VSFLPLLALVFPVIASANTIYHCTAYSGGTFWSSKHCHTHNALIDRTANVPTGIPWDQQVKIAESQRSAASIQAGPDVAQGDKATKCAGLKLERDKIWSKYSNWQYQAPEVVGPDRQRTIAIQSEQRRLGCLQQ
jgi:hypothetical protein